MSCQSGSRPSHSWRHPRIRPRGTQEHLWKYRLFQVPLRYTNRDVLSHSTHIFSQRHALVARADWLVVPSKESTDRSVFSTSVTILAPDSLPPACYRVLSLRLSTGNCRVSARSSSHSSHPVYPIATEPISYNCSRRSCVGSVAILPFPTGLHFATCTFCLLARLSSPLPSSSQSPVYSQPIRCEQKPESAVGASSTATPANRQPSGALPLAKPRNVPNEKRRSIRPKRRRPTRTPCSFPSNRPPLPWFGTFTPSALLSCYFPPSITTQTNLIDFFPSHLSILIPSSHLHYVAKNRTHAFGSDGSTTDAATERILLAT